MFPIKTKEQSFERTLQNGFHSYTGAVLPPLDKFSICVVQLLLPELVDLKRPLFYSIALLIASPPFPPPSHSLLFSGID